MPLEERLQWPVMEKESWAPPRLARLCRAFPALEKLLYRLPYGFYGRFLKLERDVSERIAERGFVFRSLAGLPAGARVLDVGSFSSSLPLELAAQGWKVWALDQRGYPFSHPDLTVVKGDVMSSGLPDGFFDAACAVSVVEHVGLGHYGDSLSGRGDLAAMAELRRVLRPGGLLVLTVPFGVPEVSSFERIYGPGGLAELSEGFTAVSSLFAVTERFDCWRAVTQEEAALASPDPRGRTRGAACLLLRRGER